MFKIVRGGVILILVVRGREGERERDRQTEGGRERESRVYRVENTTFAFEPGAKKLCFVFDIIILHVFLKKKKLPKSV